jgi:hypothetical protein
MARGARIGCADAAHHQGENTMKLFTKAQHEKLLANGRESANDPNTDHWPVVKLFTPDAGATWLLTEIDPEDTNRAYGLCDLGLGYAEFGSVWLPEIIALRGKLGLPVERDFSFEALGPISAYMKASQAEGRIVEQLPVAG